MSHYIAKIVRHNENTETLQGFIIEESWGTRSGYSCDPHALSIQAYRFSSIEKAEEAARDIISNPKDYVMIEAVK